MKHWYPQLAGIRFEALTDHAPLQHSKNQRMLSRRQLQWVGFLARLDFDIESIPVLRTKLVMNENSPMYMIQNVFTKTSHSYVSNPKEPWAIVLNRCFSIFTYRATFTCRDVSSKARDGGYPIQGIRNHLSIKVVMWYTICITLVSFRFASHIFWRLSLSSHVNVRVLSKICCAASHFIGTSLLHDARCNVVDYKVRGPSLMAGYPAMV